MGKRELLLIVAFIALGSVLYQVTAPASPGGGGFSLRGMVDHVRREIGPHEEYLGAEHEDTITLDGEIGELRVARVQQLEVRGTATPGVRLRWKVHSTGLNEQEAKELARRVALRQRQSGDILSLEFDYPPEGRQRTELMLEVPSRVRVRITRVRGGINVREVGGVELDETAGEVSLTSISGTVRGTQTGGVLAIENAAEVDITARRSEIALARIDRGVRLDLSGGELNAREIGGAVDLDANRVALELERVGGTLNADLTQGRLEVTGLAQTARIEARSTEISLDLAKVVPLTVFTTDENVEVKLPEGAGATLDASVDDGSIRLPNGAPEVNTLDQTRRATGAFRGGGPTLALRTSHADIIIR
jgi:hypothetical protein